MTRLELRFLGGLTIHQDGVPLAALKSQKGQALLCYLALTGKAHPRPALAGLLWPEMPEANALMSLRTVLNKLNNHLAPHLAVTRQSIAFNQDAPFWVDVTEFEAGVTARSDIGRMQAAVALYQGDFLEGFDLPDAPHFDGWVLAQRARLRQAALHGLYHLVSHFADRSDHETAITYARQLLDIGPWQEEAHRELMRLLVLSGQRSAALVQYETCRRILADELGVEPAAETVALYNHIRADTLVVTAEPEQNKTSSPTGFPLPTFLQDETELPRHEATRFVARGAELTRLHRYLDRTLAGEGQVAFLIGEAGRGKTALLEAFVREAQAERADLVAVLGNCSAYTGIGDPYLPFRSIATQLSGDVETQWLAGASSREQARRLWGMLPHMAEALVNVGPDLWETFVPLPQFLARAQAYAQGPAPWVKQLETFATTSAAAANGMVMQQRLFEQYGEVLKTLSRQAPLLLVLDDLQWADLGSVSLLFHLGRQLATQRIMILGAYRPVDVATGRGGERHPLQPVVGEFQRRFGDIILDLGESAGQHFVEAFLDSEPSHFDAAFRERLYQRTRGHPLFTVELWQDMRERDAIMRDDTGTWVAGPILDWQRLPTRVEATIGERINRLGEFAQSILRAASVEGETFTAEVVAHVFGVSEQTVVSQLSRDLDKTHRLVQAEGIQQLSLRRLSQYKFRHILIQNYLYNNLDESERAYLHEAIGRELEEFYGTERQRIALQLAWHFRHAGMTAKAVAYLQQASEQAIRCSANQEAIVLCQEALALLLALPDTPERSKQELALQVVLGPALLATKGYSAAEVETTYARALELCHLVEDTTVIYPTLTGLWVYYLVRGNLVRARELGEQLLSLAELVPEISARLGAQYALGVSLFFLGDFEAAYQHLETAVALYDPSQHLSLTQTFGYDPGLLAYSYAAIALWFIGYADQAEDLCQVGLRMARDYATPFTLANVLQFAALLHHLRGEVQETSAYVEEVLALSTKHGFAQLSVEALLLQSWIFIQRDQVETGIKHLHESLAQWEAAGAELATTHWNSMLAETYSQVNDHARAGQTLEKAFTLLDAGLFWEAELYRLRGELLIRRGGAAADIEASFQQALVTARRQKTRAFALRAVVSWSRWSAQLGRRSEAYRLLAEAYQGFTEGFDTADLKEAKALLDSVSQEQ